MAKFEKKMQAHALRRKGWSIKTIAEELTVAKSTVSLWCRDVTLTKAQEEKLHRNQIAAGHRGREIGKLRNQQKRLDTLHEYQLSGKNEIGQITKRDLMILATALFWAEGAKTGSRFTFVNSDPDMILCMYKYLRQIEKIDKDMFSLRIQINRIHEARIKEVLRFWSELLGLSSDQIGKPYYIDTTPKKKYTNYDSYYGIARLGVRGGSGLQYKLLGYINALK